MNLVEAILFSFLLKGYLNFVSSSLCGVTVCVPQTASSSSITCDSGRLLIENATNNERTFSSLRRICNGKTSCDIYRICQDPRNRNLRVYYTCNTFPLTDPLQMCTNDIMVVNQENGVILSPQYPAIVTSSCSWMIKVPKDHFAVITVHDVERQMDNCNGGLQIRTKHSCMNSVIPPGLICQLEKHSNVYRACGDVDIDLVTNMISGLRFWLSYQVLPFNRNSDHLRYNMEYSCPVGTETEQPVRRVHVDLPGIGTEAEVKHAMPPIVITRTVSILNTSIHIDNDTSINSIETKRTTGINTAERMIFYVAIAVAFLSLNGLIIVTVICIRRQRRLKANGPVIDHSKIPSTLAPPFNCNRPLPPVVPPHMPLTSSPSLMEGYGVVADDITNGSNDQTSQYAEVDDTLPYRHKCNTENPKNQEQIENVYSEVNDCDKNGYWEIADTVWHNTPYSQTDHAKLIKKEKFRKSQSSNNSIRSRPSSFEGPYSHLDRKRQSELSEQTDSEDSLFGNEQYDYIESANV